jgi:hypothetical protein
MEAGTLEIVGLLMLVTQVEDHGSHVLVAMKGQDAESVMNFRIKASAGGIPAIMPIPVREIHPGTMGTWIDNIQVTRDDMPITMREMIDSLTGRLWTMKGTMIGMIAGTTTGMMVGQMTIRLIGLSQESRVRTVFSFFPLFCCMRSSMLAL